MSTSLPFDVEMIVSEPFGENSYVAHLHSRSECVILDPGFEPDLIIDYVEKNGLVPEAILITHGHSDHIAGNHALKGRWPNCPIIVGRGDAPKLTDPWQNLSAMFGVGLTSPPADKAVDEGDMLEVAGFRFDIREIPGHSSGHIVFVERQWSPHVVFGGDVLFAGSIGRTDFPGGSLELLARGIQEKLYALPDDTIVFSGHGPPTTVGREKATNPFVREGA